MKKILTFILSLILSLSAVSFIGCNNGGDDGDNNIFPSLAGDEMQVLVLTRSASSTGKVIEQVGSNAILVTITSYDKPYGETVYVIKDNIGEFCVDDSVSITYDKVHIPNDTSKYCRLIATSVYNNSISMPARKPIIYLYPTVETKVSVSLTLNGYFTCTYPDYGVNGWQNFTAKPDGTLISPEGKEYYALYWEGVLDTDYDLSLGWCIKGSDTAKFLEWALAEQGLTPREANEFIMYWLPLMQDNAYNVISFQTEDYVNNAVLNITPKPDSVLRVFMTYYSSDTMVDIAPETLKGFTRNGFTVVEWGGSEINK